MASGQIEGRRVIITGGASGMAAALVGAFAREGAKVVSMDLNETEGAKVAEAANGAGPGEASFIRCDVTQRASVEAAFAEATKRLGGLDVLINAAGVAPFAPSHLMTDEQWDFVLDVNAKGTFLTNQAAFPHLKEKGGRIINFASGAGAGGYPGKAHYAASKAAVLGWTRSIAREWGRYGITANSICPGIRTPMFEKTLSEMTPEQREAQLAKHRENTPIDGQMGDATRDLAPVLVFLAGDGARFMTGQMFSIDGGRFVVR